MLDHIISLSISNKLIVGLLTLGLVIWGSYSLTQLPIDAVPDITNNQVQVITTSPSLAAEEVERLITFPVEITMATIPKLDEVRSISRFGLSVVTLVFEEAVDVYWARQQVSERLSAVQAQIPPGIGQPGMAPVTTGLGEIYQYVVKASPGYEDQYDAQALRTIQDWIVRRQLLGTPGVADVSSFGGFLKQYEIAVDPHRLRAMNVSLGDLFGALEANNENTGGAYIEKNLNAYFIRSEGLVGDLDELGQIAIKQNQEGIPVLIRDVAHVQIGHAVRYGATTRNGEGEVVSAVVMMLKGENSAQVISRVKTRIDQIGKTLPEGIMIVPFLDRTKLVNTAIGTVTTNLIEGALIVILVLLLLLGNLRAGLVVASVIPLALLFAFGLMNLFGVSGNLMSLGAIDFGLIVDGAVIIVEATLHHLSKLRLGRKLTQAEMDQEVYQSASKIRHSAAFGELIILIVYLPLLALVGTEGKMFRPMAQTVSFAILGAFLLSLTYVPMVSALFLSKRTTYKPNVSDQIMRFFHRLYDPAIRWAMHKRLLVLSSALGLFGCALWIFATLGGEFIPTLEEGDFAVETRVMTGSSLENTVRATTQAEQILLKNFPEVQQVVSKIGSGEIPTDPMPMEVGDMMIILKKKSEWQTATNREGLASAMAEALEAIPGVSFGFQQPIQMRFNELMSGARQDVAIKIYGESLDKLSEYAAQVGRLVAGIEGATDLYVEEIAGVPQVVISYRREQLAKFGLSVRDVNRTVQAAFAGATAGLVYEYEKRFELVVRLDKAHRQEVASVKNLYIAQQDGRQIPLHQVADVRISDQPYQIQRDDARRRILVAFNVRNRDVESVVTELQQKIDESVAWAPGYSVAYGGQFENLVEARQRLTVAVPLALLLIFTLLYFTFGSAKQGILIFTAIPLSAIGGIFALWLRDMPFSISAGVGFIALFGVAVLNGIVLIGEFNHLKKAGVADIFERIYAGTRVRLRPVIMTASVASLGFLPMALSNSGGAEVQRPLATVVIGGLLSATLLTLVVLPVLYYYFERGLRRKPAAVALLVLVIGGCCWPPPAQAQDTVKTYTSLEAAIQVAIARNPDLIAADLQTQQARALKGTSWNLPNTSLSLMRGQYNSIFDNDHQFNISQTVAFPTVYVHQNKLAQARAEASEWTRLATQHELVQQVKATWYALWAEKSRRRTLQAQDSLFARFVAAATLRYETGESNLLEKATAASRVAQIKVLLQQNLADIEIYKTQLQVLLHADAPVDISVGQLEARDARALLATQPVADHPRLAWFGQQVIVAEKEKLVEKNRLLPYLTVGYFNQSLNGFSQDREGNPVVFGPSDRFTGFSVGLAVPLFGARTHLAAIWAAELRKQEAEARWQAATRQWQGRWQSLQQQYQKFRDGLEYYESNALPQADLILKQAQQGFESGDIGYVEYTQGLDQALGIQFNYLDLLNQYNQTVIEIEFILDIQ